jgi:hypothetical protein
MTTAQVNLYPDIAPPPGAEFADDWEGDSPHRVIVGFDRTVTDHTARVYAVVIQMADGSIDEGLIEGPHANIADGERSGIENLNSDQARELAAALLEAADEIDEWVARMTTEVCGISWCGHDVPGHLEHNWTDGVIVVEPGRPTKRVYTWLSIQEGFEKPLLIGIEDPNDDSSGAEAWLSIEDAEYLRDALSKAISYASRSTEVNR